MTPRASFIAFALVALIAACSGEDRKRVADPAGGTGNGGSGGTGGNGADGGSSGSGTASSGPEMFLPLYENGSRLRAVSLGPPGSSFRQLRAWYDTELDAECEFALAEDGEYRCLPFGRRLAPGFADATCNEPIWYESLVTPCSSSPPYRTEAVDGSSCAAKRVYRLTELALTDVYHEACDGPITLPAGAVVFGEDTPMSPSEFVRAEWRERTNDDGVGVRELIGEDGSRMVASIFDAELGACSPREIAEAGVRCIPTAGALDQEWWYADAACSSEQLAYAGRRDGCLDPEPPTLAFRFNIDAPGTPPGVLAIGAPVSGTVYERSFDGSTCTEHDSADVLWTLHPIEGPFDTDRLLAVSEQIRGEGRLQLVHRVVGETLLTLRTGELSRPIFHDAMKSAACEGVRTSAGDWVCLADAVFTQGGYYYADDECTAPVAIAPREGTRIFATARFNSCVREAFDGSAVEEALEIFVVGEPHTGPVYQGPPEFCAPWEPPEPMNFVTLLPATADDMPALEETIEE